MSLTILVAPAGAGKTDWAVSQMRDAAAALGKMPQLVVPSHVQVFDCKKRLAQNGGALGVEIITLDELAWKILEEGDVYLSFITKNLQIDLLKKQIKDLDLNYYSKIKDTPGFVRRCLDVIQELKAGGITPEIFTEAVEKNHLGPRLSELGLIYYQYEKCLMAMDLVDSAGVLKKAVSLILTTPHIFSEGGLLIFDGFDDLSPVQLRLVAELAGSNAEVFFTLTGSEKTRRSKLIHKRFHRLLDGLSTLDGVVIRPLAEIADLRPEVGVISSFRNRIFSQESGPGIDAEGTITLAAVPDREAEVRAALRWIKQLQVKQGIPPGKTAILMRNPESYRSILSRVSREYDLDLRIQAGVPLAENPLIAAIQALLKEANSGDEGPGWRGFQTLWLSPYLKWEFLYNNLGIEYNDQKHSFYGLKYKEIVHWGAIVRGHDQWNDAFDRLVEEINDREQKGIPQLLGMDSVSVQELKQLFQGFLDSITPPGGVNQVSIFVSWIENILGMDEGEQIQGGVDLVGQILAGGHELALRDLKALQKFIHILREMIRSDKLFEGGEVTFSHFWIDLTGAIGNAVYQPWDLDQGLITSADIREVRGISYLAVALLGLAEGELPGTIQEDPFLRDQDRADLSEHPGLDLQFSTDSAEADYFIEAVNRATDCLLITRPRITDTGAPWQASPYWEEILRCLITIPRLETTSTRHDLSSAGSLAEYFEILAGSNRYPLRDWIKIADRYLSQVETIQTAANIIQIRVGGADQPGDRFNGNLEELEHDFQSRFPEDHVWSSSRLESYLSCPYQFYSSTVLRLEKPEPPGEGLNSRQLGNIYHHILEKLYRDIGDVYSLDDLLSQLPRSAEAVFAAAPDSEGFRVKGWWQYTQANILSNLQKTLIVLENLDPAFVFYRAEQAFGIQGQNEPELRIQVKELGSYRLRGFIDRVDRNPLGDLRIVDYKTSGATGFTNQALIEGKKLQLPFYALAAEKTLRLGRVKEGFYFHVQTGEPSYLKLSGFRKGDRTGPSAAIETAVEKGWQAVQSIQKGHFQPRTPDGGCPDYCAAAEYCWSYRPGSW